MPQPTPDFAHAHEVDDLGELDPAWKGILVDWLEVAGTRTRLLRRAADDGVAPGAPTIVCVHGLGGSATNFTETMGPLAALGDVIALDLPGFGECAPQPDIAPNPQANARFLAATLDELALGPVVLVGNSMGGLISMLVAARRPDLVKALVLLGAALPGYLPAVRISKVQAKSFGPLLVPVLGKRWIRRRMERMTWRERYLDTVLNLVADPGAVPERTITMGTANLAREADLRWRGRSFLQATEGLLKMVNLSGAKATIRQMQAVEAPTLFLRGASDPLVLHAPTALVRRLDLGWTVEEPPNVGHLPQLEAPDLVADHLRTLLAQQA